ncbi:hypothetical protein PsexTeo8_23630 [Pseudomonas extremaustralis]|nr:hypothetical protein [Pseudomonas extremaustralis]
MMAQYEEAGFAIDVKELPDYIPLYLEFLSTREDIEAREGLADVAHLLALLAARLDERESAYASCFRALLQIAGAEPHQAVAELRAQVAAEPVTTPRSPGQDLGRGSGGLYAGRTTGPLQFDAQRTRQSPRRKRGAVALGGFSARRAAAVPAGEVGNV